MKYDNDGPKSLSILLMSYSADAGILMKDHTSEKHFRTKQNVKKCII